jgi:hypothetical protein
VLASLCDASAGAREFDYSLARHFAEEIQVPLGHLTIIAAAVTG